LTTGTRVLADYMADARVRVDAVLATWGNSAFLGTLERIRAAVGYSLLGAGKRLRPTLVFACSDAVAGVGSVAELAAAIEVVHAYSLVHDDLPCMDNDDLRRGRPTTHRAFDVPTATRAGFLMVPLATAVLAHGFEDLGLEPERRQAIALELFRAAGAGGMIGGQTLDLEAEGIQVSLERLAEIHERKTGALIAAACVIGGLAGGATPGAAQALRRYGADVGLAFQIYDDVLDATATSDALGKTAGKDAARAKSTFVARLGVEPARREAERLAERAVGHLGEGGVESEVLVHLARYIVTRPN
jgi:geranylgeranyl diphosphate synthase, type II